MKFGQLFKRRGVVEHVFGFEKTQSRHQNKVAIIAPLDELGGTT